MAMIILSASVKRFSVSRMQDLKKKYKSYCILHIETSNSSSYSIKKLFAPSFAPLAALLCLWLVQHCTRLQYTTLHCSKLVQYATPTVLNSVQYTTLHYTKVQYISLHCTK